MKAQAASMVRRARHGVRRRTGRLARSISGPVNVRGGHIEAKLYSDHPGARIQDEGGRIRAGRRDMPVPIGDVKVHPRSVSGLFLLRAKSGKRFLATKTAGNIRLWFRLMSEVNVPATRWAQKAHERTAQQVPGALLQRIHKRVT